MKKKEIPRPMQRDAELRVRPCAWGLIRRGAVQDPGTYEAGGDHRIIVETLEVLKREHYAKFNGNRGGNQT